VNVSDGYVHQQASLTAGTVAYDDKLSTDFRHRDGGGVKSKGATGSREIGMRLSDADNLESQVGYEIRQLVVESRRCKTRQEQWMG
jgi:hypothetical protein